MEIIEQENCIIIKLDNKEYLFSTIMLMRDIDYCSEIDKNDSLSSKDKLIMLTRSKQFGENILSIDNITDRILSTYIHKLIERNDYIKEYFDRTNFDDEYDKLWNSIKFYFASVLYSALKKFIDENKTQIGLITQNMAKALTDFSGYMSKIINSIVNSQGYRTFVNSLLTSFQKIGESIINYINSLDLPGIDDSRKKELCKIFKEWGKYGWTMCDFVSYKEYFDEPKNILEADQRILKYCTSKEIDAFFDELEVKSVRKKDIKEAVKCYKNKYYKASAMIMFSLIDSILIRKNLNDFKKAKKNGEKVKLQTGVNAILSYKTKVENDSNVEAMIFDLFRKVSLFKALFTFFEDTDNFSKKFNIVNRNYLDHGMTSKPVRKKDCIKLFFIYDNLLEFTKSVL